MFRRVSLLFSLLVGTACVAAGPLEQPDTLLGFIDRLARQEPLDATKLSAILPTELAQVRANESINRRDYEARDISFRDGTVGLVDFRQVGPNSLTVINISEGCLRIDDVQRRFKLDENITPNRTHTADGSFRRSNQPWGRMAFELIGSSPCVRSVVLSSGLG